MPAPIKLRIQLKRADCIFTEKRAVKQTDMDKWMCQAVIINNKWSVGGV